MDKSASASGKHQKKCKDGTDITHGVSKDSIDNGGHEGDAQRLAVLDGGTPACSWLRDFTSGAEGCWLESQLRAFVQEEFLENGGVLDGEQFVKAMMRNLDMGGYDRPGKRTLQAEEPVLSSATKAAAVMDLFQHVDVHGEGAVSWEDVSNYFIEQGMSDAMKLGGIVVLALLGSISAQREAPTPPQRPPREAREEREEAQQGLVACRLAGKTPEECYEGFRNSTGGTPADKVKERFELEKGAPKALLGTLENCTRDIAASNASFDECKEQLKTLLQTLKSETLTDEEVEREIRKIAGEKAQARS
ncbi:unnamed protein product, partial [Symbiodinium sp. KB8]